MSSSSKKTRRKRRKKKGSDIFDTPFGEIDRKSRGIAFYVVMGIMIAIASGMTIEWVKLPRTQFFDPLGGVGIAVIASMWLFAVGIPLISFRGAEPEYEEVEAVQPQAVPEESKESLWDAAQRHRTGKTSEEIPQVAEAEIEDEEEQKDAKYWVKMPRRKRSDENIGK